MSSSAIFSLFNEIFFLILYLDMLYLYRQGHYRGLCSWEKVFLILYNLRGPYGIFFIINKVFKNKRVVNFLRNIHLRLGFKDELESGRFAQSALAKKSIIYVRIQVIGVKFAICGPVGLK